MSVKDWMSTVRSTFRFSDPSIFLKTIPMTHMVLKSSLVKEKGLYIDFFKTLLLKQHNLLVLKMLLSKVT